MLRATLLYLSQAGWARKLITGWSLSWRVASRFIAGETLDDALAAVKTLNEKGMYATLDHLGEYTHSVEDAEHATDRIVETIQRIQQENLKTGLSLKLSKIGLEIDEELCFRNLSRAVQTAVESNVFLRIDMEDSTYVDRTLALYERLEEQFGVENLGLVIQSYLYRSMEDTQSLVARGVRIRLVKGAYREPPEVAFPKKADVDHEFDRLTDKLIELSIANGAPEARKDGRVPPIPAIASHDEARVQYAIDAANKMDFPKQALEFQMLFGIRRDLQDSLLADGYPVRIYVPFGSEWYPYFMRRLAERPANLWFFLSNLLRK
jgi:proline dehydrogenase